MRATGDERLAMERQMTADIETAKKELVSKYDAEAEDFDTEAWLQEGDSVRVPESRSAWYFVERKVRRALELVPPARTWRAHEIGCSFGQMTSLLSREFDTLLASDISPRSVAIARKRLQRYGIHNVSLLQADAERLEMIRDASFEVVYSFSTIRFCPRPEQALREIRRTLVRGGAVVVDFPNARSPWHSLLKPILGIRPHAHDRLYTAAEAAALLREAGFTEVRAITFLFTSRRLPALFLPLFKAIDAIGERIPLLRSFAGIIMVCGRNP